ncbi:hypothetical protein PInf_025590 [Phytophthora infestans]|nr:hypothetical protein PInf_025590 [Phytophthora infestans]
MESLSGVGVSRELSLRNRDMEAYLRKHWPQGSVSVSCRVYASQRRADEHKRLQLTAKGIELRSVGSSSEPDVIPWVDNGASESTSGIRRRFVSVYEGDEYGEEKEFVVFGCVSKLESEGSGGLLGGLTSLAKADGDAAAMRTVKAIRFLADPRVEQGIKATEKLLDPYGSLAAS